jgi:hypothetical protein
MLKVITTHNKFGFLAQRHARQQGKILMAFRHGDTMTHWFTEDPVYLTDRWCADRLRNQPDAERRRPRLGKRLRKSRRGRRATSALPFDTVPDSSPGMGIHSKRRWAARRYQTLRSSRLMAAEEAPRRRLRIKAAASRSSK